MLDFLRVFYTAVIIPVGIPLLSVLLAFHLTKKHYERVSKREEKTQRIKLLTLLNKEAEMFSEYWQTNNQHRSKRFMTINMVLESPAFNVNEHQKLIELALDIERLNQNIETALNVSTNLYSASLGGYLSNLSTGNPLMMISNSKIMKLLRGKTQVEGILEGLEKMNKTVIENSTQDAMPLLVELIIETNRLLRIEQSSYE